MRPSASLGTRLLAGVTVLILVAMTVTGAVMAYALRHFIQGQVDGRLDGELTAVADALRPAPAGGWQLERNVDGPPFDRPGSDWSWTVLDPGPVLRSRSLAGGDVAFGDVQAAPPHPPPPGAERGLPPPPGSPPATATGRAADGRALRVRLRVLPLGGRDVTILAAAPHDAIAGPLRDAMTPVLVALALLALLLIVAGLLQIGLGLRPLRALRGDLVAVRNGTAARIAGPQPAEVRPVVEELNALLDQHAANLERARRHVANLAHSLKTPLATLALALDEPPEAAGPRLKPLVAAMDRMIRHHLARARAAALGGPARARVDLAGRLADHRVALGRLHADRAIAITLDVPGDLAVGCEAQDLDEVLGNILDNACRFAAHRVVVRATAAGAEVVVEVADDGPGLTAPQIADVLRPGLRADETTPGYGFGLPIASELAELYGGGVALARADDLGGLRVRITLPRA